MLSFFTVLSSLPCSVLYRVLSPFISADRMTHQLHVQLPQTLPPISRDKNRYWAHSISDAYSQIPQCIAALWTHAAAVHLPLPACRDRRASLAGRSRSYHVNRLSKLSLSLTERTTDSNCCNFVREPWQCSRLAASEQHRQLLKL